MCVQWPYQHCGLGAVTSVVTALPSTWQFLSDICCLHICSHILLCLTHSILNPVLLLPLVFLHTNPQQMLGTHQHQSVSLGTEGCPVPATHVGVHSTCPPITPGRKLERRKRALQSPSSLGLPSSLAMHWTSEAQEEGIGGLGTSSVAEPFPLL